MAAEYPRLFGALKAALQNAGKWRETPPAVALAPDAGRFVTWEEASAEIEALWEDGG